MSVTTRSFRYGIAFAILSVFFTVAVYAQTPATPDGAPPATSLTPVAPDTAVPTTQPGALPPNYMFPGTSPTPGALGPMEIPGMMGGGAMSGMQPGMMGGMSPMGMQPGGYMGGMAGGMGGFGPDMNAMLAQQLQEYRMRETQLNNQILQAGGETSPMAQAYLIERAKLQGQIKAIESQLAPGATTPAMPGMNPAMTPPGMQGMSGYGGALTPTDMMAQEMFMARMQGMGGYSGFGTAGIMGMGANPTMFDQQRLMLERQRANLHVDLQLIQRQLSFMNDPNDASRAYILAQQQEVLDQISALEKQLEQFRASDATTPNGMTPPGGLAPNAAGSTATTLAERVAQPVRPTTPVNPQTAQLQELARQYQAAGRTAEAAEVLQLLAQLETQPRFPEPQLSANVPLQQILPLIAPPPTPAAMPQQAEIAELRATVDSLRSEIAAMREDMRMLQMLLRQYNQGSGYEEYRDPGFQESLQPQPLMPGNGGIVE